jgi:coproporphyrinogen III oxidase
MSEINDAAVEEYLRSLQARIVASLEDVDGKAKFRQDRWDRPGGGGGDSRVLVDGAVFEQAGVGFSLVFGKEMPVSGRWASRWYYTRETRTCRRPMPTSDSFRPALPTMNRSGGSAAVST